MSEISHTDKSNSALPSERIQEIARYHEKFGAIERLMAADLLREVERLRKQGLHEKLGDFVEQVAGIRPNLKAFDPDEREADVKVCRKHIIEFSAESCDICKLGGASTPSQTWISVSERLPEIDAKVILWLAEGVSVTGIRTESRWHIDDNEGVMPFNPEQVTHWMPLPSPPPSEGGAASASQPQEK